MTRRIIHGFKNECELYLVLSMFSKLGRKSKDTDQVVFDSIWYFHGLTKKHGLKTMHIEDLDHFSTFIAFDKIHKPSDVHFFTPSQYILANLHMLQVFGDNYDKTPYFIFDPCKHTVSEGYPNAGRINDYRHNKQYHGGDCYILPKKENLWYLI